MKNDIQLLKETHSSFPVTDRTVANLYSKLFVIEVKLALSKQQVTRRVGGEWTLAETREGGRQMVTDKDGT